MMCLGGSRLQLSGKLRHHSVSGEGPEVHTKTINGQKGGMTVWCKLSKAYY